jgi:hypothetical protein
MKPTDPTHTPKRWLRVKRDGFLFEWDPILANNTACEEVADHIVFPEKYAENPEPTTPRQKGRPRKNLGVEQLEQKVTEAENPPTFTSDDFSAEVGKGWPK